VFFYIFSRQLDCLIYIIKKHTGKSRKLSNLYIMDGDLKKYRRQMNLRKTTKIFMVILALLVFSVFSLTVKADIYGAGSENDPLVTKSYIDKIVLNIKQYIDSNSDGGAQNLEVVYLERGEIALGDQGTEIILRSGIATVIDGAQGGLCDVTSGIDLGKGINVPQNHLLIVPRGDGRGVRAENDYVVLLVRGSYTIDR